MGIFFSYSFPEKIRAQTINMSIRSTFGVATLALFFIANISSSIIPSGDKLKCIPDYAGPCYEDSECCTKHCSNFICRPPSENSEVDLDEQCIPDYAGPCYVDSECCTKHCSNFICRPPSGDENTNEKA